MEKHKVGSAPCHGHIGWRLGTAPLGHIPRLPAVSRFSTGAIRQGLSGARRELGDLCAGVPRLMAEGLESRRLRCDTTSAAGTSGGRAPRTPARPARNQGSSPGARIAGDPTVVAGR